jgi:predicted dehydrogenase
VKEKLRIGVIGVGHLGEYHVQKYVAMPEVELVGVVDTDYDRANEIARRYQTRPFGEVAKDILSRGIHLLIEKPITYTLEPADTLIRLAQEKDLVLQVGLVERFNPAVVKMESLLKDPVFIESHRMNLFTTRGTDVDVVLDLMIHDLDIILHVVPAEVKEVHAVGMSVLTGKTDIANVRIIFENGTVANLTASRVSDRTLRKIRVFQPDAYMAVDCFRREISVTKLDSEAKNEHNFPQVTTNKTKFPGNDPLADEISSFVHAIMNGEEPVVSGRDGRRALQYALGIIDQIERGCKDFQAVC